MKNGLKFSSGKIFAARPKFLWKKDTNCDIVCCDNLTIEEAAQWQNKRRSSRRTMIIPFRRSRPAPGKGFGACLNTLLQILSLLGVVELTTQLLILENILWLPLCRINKFGLNTLPSKTVAIPYTCGLSRLFSGAVAGEHSSIL